MRRRVALSLLTLASLALSLPAAAFLSAPPAAAQGITSDGVLGHLRALDAIAAGNGGNRAAGTPGGNATSAYVAGRLEAAGWIVTRQQVTFPYFGERSPPVVGTLRPGADIVTARYSGSGEVTARVFPLRRSGCRRRDFRGFPRGRIAVSLFAGCPSRRIALNAQRAGALAMLLASGEARPPTPPSLLRPGLRIPGVVVRDPPALRLARRRPRVRVRVDAFVEQRTVENLVGELPGAGGERVVMAGGHLDSVPESPGINDNGSGVAALLGIAEGLATAPRAPQTLRLGFWTAEELDLAGSRAYVRSLPAPERRRVAAYINVDMAGSPNAVPEIYASRDRILRALRRQVPRAGRTSVHALSDHTAFLRAGIPVGGLYTGSEEPKTRREARVWGGRPGRRRDPCYHRPCDTLANVDAAMTARMANAAAAALLELAR